MNHAEEVSNILKDLKAVLGPQGVRMVDKISAHMDEMTGQIETLKHANSLDIWHGDALACQPAFMKIHFSPMQRKMLAYIIGRGSSGASKEGIYAAMYGDRLECDQPDIKVLDIVIFQIRQKLRAAGFHDCIENIYGHGYRYKPDPSIKPLDMTG